MHPCSGISPAVPTNASMLPNSATPRLRNPPTGTLRPPHGGQSTRMKTPFEECTCGVPADVKHSLECRWLIRIKSASAPVRSPCSVELPVLRTQVRPAISNVSCASGSCAPEHLLSPQGCRRDRIRTNCPRAFPDCRSCTRNIGDATGGETIRSSGVPFSPSPGSRTRHGRSRLPMQASSP